MWNNIGLPGLIVIALIFWGLWKIFSRSKKK
ncbi:hypothetical protein TP2_18105 [Thioclava pacifica DSM 10166]|uniref:Uncharacterized protein n=1 Tax=Thioclava pacifica DSM 10166 TaxID=1353537 RepID=A0A074JVC9_9RHOB|nr:hypothetical protein TP2_18105 [Thioclava pacifica DSM 10166]